MARSRPHWRWRSRQGARSPGTQAAHQLACPRCSRCYVTHVDLAAVRVDPAEGAQEGRQRSAGEWLCEPPRRVSRRCLGRAHAVRRVDADLDGGLGRSRWCWQPKSPFRGCSSAPCSLLFFSDFGVKFVVMTSRHALTAVKTAPNASHTLPMMWDCDEAI